MEFKEAMRALHHICWAHDECKRCPMHIACYEGISERPDEAESILAKWAAEHPEKTIADDFYEKHPNAPRDDTNNPYPCAKDCGYSKPPYCERIPINCDNCWRRPLEEVE